MKKGGFQREGVPHEPLCRAYMPWTWVQYLVKVKPMNIIGFCSKAILNKSWSYFYEVHWIGCWTMNIFISHLMARVFLFNYRKIHYYSWHYKKHNAFSYNPIISFFVSPSFISLLTLSFEYILILTFPKGMFEPFATGNTLFCNWRLY